LNQPQPHSSLQADYASSILYLLALSLSKCSVIALIMRLTTNRQHRQVSWAVIAAVSVWTGTSILAISVSCTPAGPFDNLDEQCSGLVSCQTVLRRGRVLTCNSQYSRWIYIGAVDIVTELAIFAMSIYLVAALKMSLKMKATVVTAFALRLPYVSHVTLQLTKD
jgi:hypothetical protein